MEKCFFVVWTPNILYVEEIQIDVSFFEEMMSAASILIKRVVLPEIIGCWFTKPREETDSESAPCSSSTGESGPSSSSTGDEDTTDTYCYCNRVDDGSKMICCDNDTIWLVISVGFKFSWISCALLIHEK